MSHETADLIAFLHEVIEMRVKDLSEQALKRADFIEINQKLVDFMDGITDERVREILQRFEDMKNEYCGMIMSYLYNGGLQDSLALYGMLRKRVLLQ